mgnify:CR=1 FL=1
MSDILIKLLKKHDTPARDTTLKFIKNTISNPDKYGVDVLLKNCKYLQNIEVQTLTYKTFIDNFKILTVFKRKDRYNLNTVYITYNYNYTKCFIFCRCQLDKEKMIKSKIKYSVRDEDKMFYLHKNEILYIENINKDTLNLKVIKTFFKKTIRDYLMNSTPSKEIKLDDKNNSASS